METNQSRKRIRLSLACNRCRTRKVRCDEQQPSCRNCTLAGTPCVTTDPRRANQDVSHSRRRAGTTEIIATDHESNESPRESSTCTDERASNIEFLLDRRDPPTFEEGNEEGQIEAGNFPEESNNHHSDLPLDLDARRSSVHLGTGREMLTPITNGSPAFAMNVGNDSAHRKYLGPSSLQVFTQWLELTFHTPAHSERFKFGMRYCEEMEIPLHTSLPALPPNWRRYVDIYFRDVAPVFPVHDQSILQFAEAVQQLTDLSGAKARDRPVLASVYACIAIGAYQQGELGLGQQYLEAAYSLYAHLVSFPYLQSAQALLLITITLRGRNKDGASWQTLGQALRILHSIGSHRKSSTSQLQEQLTHVERRVWWSAYCLERIMALETGRPSSICEDEIDQDLLFDTPDGAPVVLKHLIGLAKIQNTISTRLFSRSMGIAPPNPADIFRTQGELDQSLLVWLAGVPDALRPDRDPLSCPTEMTALRSFFVFQYHQTMATLHRAALLVDANVYRADVKKYCANPKHIDRLCSGENICLSSARGIATTLLQLLHEQGLSRLNTLTQPLMSIHILAIHTLKHPSTWSVRSDLGLLQTAAEAIEQCYRADGQDADFCTMVGTLKQFASKMTNGASTALVPSAQRTSVADSSNTTEADPQHFRRSGPRLLQQDESLSGSGESPDMTSDFATSLWPYIYTGDLQPMVGQEGFLDMYELMGVPRLSDQDISNLTFQ